MMDEIDVPFWTFDLKQDYRHLLQNREELLVLPWAELKFNPLKPPEGVPPRRWAQVFAEIFGHATALLSGSKNYLMRSIIQLYQLYDLFDHVNAPYPSLHELQRLHEADKINYMRKTANYRDTVLNRLDAMNLTAGTVFDCSEGYSVEDLLNRNIVFEFDGLGTDVQNFLMEVLFAAVYEYRVAHDQRGGDLRHVFFLDEGKRVFSVYKERQDAAGIPAIDELTAKMREFGEGLIVADQEASKLTDSIKANTDTKILLATGDSKQFESLTASMHLSERQEDIAQQLGIGEAIVQSGNRDPVPVRLDNYELEKDISDEELRKHQAERWDELSSTPRETTTEFEQQVHVRDDMEIPDDSVQKIELSDDSETMLKDIVEHPCKLLTERYELFPNEYHGNKAKEELVENKIVEERVLKGAETRKLFELTQTGREYVETRDDMEIQQKERGGIVHRCWQQKIKEVIEEAGWSASTEACDADIWTIMDGTELVVEVAMGNNKREVEHVEKHLDTGFDVIWIACPDEEVKQGLQERIEEHGLNDEVTFRLLKEFDDPDALFE